MSSPGSMTHSPATPFTTSASKTAVVHVDARLQAYRTVIGAIMMSLLWKASYYPLAFSLYREFRLVDEFFPSLFRSPEVLAGLMILPLVLGLVAMFLLQPDVFTRINPV